MSIFTFAINIKSVKSTQTSPTVEWSKLFGRAIGHNVGARNTVVQTRDGGYAIASTADLGAGETWLLIKVDSAGNIQWNKTYEVATPNAVWSLVQTGDGGYAMLGQSGTP
jgi:hypothetical protein